MCQRRLTNRSAPGPTALGPLRGHHASLSTTPHFPLLTPISLLAVRPQTCPCPSYPSPRPCPEATHHPDGSEGHEPVATVAAGPGVPARVLAFLQDEHLPPEVGLLKGDPAGHERDGEGGEARGAKVERREIVSSKPTCSTWKAAPRPGGSILVSAT